MDGMLTCARYAFAPNYYKYCGPDANREISSYIHEGESDDRLGHYLSKFSVLYPYLNLIAHENDIANPFDEKVVEAYWLGNNLLEKVGMKSFANHLYSEQRLKDKIPKKMLKWVIEKIPKAARVHHSFHVLNIFTRTGHHAVDHTLDTMDNCRIGWGQISSRLDVDNSSIEVDSQKLAYQNGSLLLEDGVKRTISLNFKNGISKELRIGDWVSYHWGFVCDKISKKNVDHLKAYTEYHLRLANETL